MKRDTIPLTKPIPVKLPPEILARVDALAKRIGEPRSTVMRIAMRVGLEQLEKAFDAPALANSGKSPEERFLEIVKKHLPPRAKPARQE